MKIVAAGLVLFALAGCASSGKSSSTKPTSHPAATTAATNATAPPTTKAGPFDGKTPLGAPKPRGIDGSVWDQYCIQGSDLVNVLKGADNGTLTNDEVVSELSSVEKNISDDASAAGVGNDQSKALGVQMQSVADAIGRVKVAVSNGGSPDYNEIVTAVQALPSCS
jgi:hypothetical protein